MRKLQNTGEWKPVIEWMDKCAGGHFSIPFGSRPPVTRNENGTLNVTNRVGTQIAELGDYLYFTEGQFFVEHQSHNG